ncbi:hypothetical protein NDK47_21185 [Brevibacillus ruminantium]|uniref:Pre-toxin TG domain-containing protein n=1 Tax=Brevibacillus ruminantium TaxID=2950604 RepID=A0ABY4WBT0_9BACL|nr:hypothetical protein [Brevibacillus ruminantium]USG64633.1 hypothetical protein NDK47_21185 [Brevibacillus ruminantium]
MSEETREMYIDRYIKYGPDSIPKGLKSTVEIMADPSGLIPGAGGIRIVQGVGKAVITAINGAKIGRTAYDIAKEGGKHSGFYKQYKGKTEDEVKKGIESINKQITEHLDKIKSPEKYIPDFKKLDSRQQEALINKKWPSDIQRQMEQRDILKGILKEVFGVGK